MASRHLMQPVTLSLTSQSEKETDEKGSGSRTNQRNTHQSFTTVIQSSEHRAMDQKYDSHMSRFIPAIFNKNFSQTYADLLKNMHPHEIRSELDDSELGLLGPVFRSGHKEQLLSPSSSNVILEDVPKSPRKPSPIKASVKKVKEVVVDPELEFYRQVLKSMRNTHKDVVS